MESAQANYTPPVDQLLTYGEAEGSNPTDWPNYLELGIGPEHVPNLIRMMGDKELSNEDADGQQIWAPLHAWRTLGQLRAETAIEAIIKTQETSEDTDWALTEIPYVLGMIGPAALPALTARLTDISYDDEQRFSIIGDIEKIGNQWPEARDTCVEILTKQLELFEENDPETNGFLILALIDLHATEAAPLVERAYAARSVDPMVVGDWNDAQVEFGLLTAEEVEQRRASIISQAPTRASLDSSVFPQVPKGTRQHSSGDKKTKKKMAKQSRKKNRKR
ncbi:MAG: hypothetical protein H0V70_03930 [Ktedonobacteraceae bacterium]|nr:hypothetical protein [Ktedonobacteraceae bacterium]